MKDYMQISEEVKNAIDLSPIEVIPKNSMFRLKEVQKLLTYMFEY